jgi:hypothetical protein
MRRVGNFTLFFGAEDAASFESRVGECRVKCGRKPGEANT